METIEKNKNREELLKQLPNGDFNYWKNYYSDKLNGGEEMNDLVRARYLSKLEIIKKIEETGGTGGTEDLNKKNIPENKTIQNANINEEEKQRRIKELEQKIEEVRNRIKGIKQEKIDLENPSTTEKTQDNNEEEPKKEGQTEGLEPKIIDNLSLEQIKKNKETIDATLEQVEKNILAKEVNELNYGDKSRDLLLDETEKEEYGKKIKDALKNITQKFRKKFWLSVGIGTLYFASTGFTTDGDGQLHYSYKKAIKPLVETGINVLPNTEGQYAKRGLWKMGLYDLQEDTVQFTEAKKHYEEKVHRENSIKKAKNDSIAHAEEEQQIKEKKEYFEKNTYFQKIDEVKDYRSSNNKETNKLMRYRNQWANENGFTYIAAPNKGNRQGQNITYNNVEGVGHFLLDADISVNQTGGFSSKDSHYMHQYDQRYIKVAKNNNQYLPVFKRVNENNVLVQYKRANELGKNDEIMSPLRQFNFDDIDFTKFKQPISFKASVKEVMLKSGVKNPYMGINNTRGTNLIFVNKNMKQYGQFSGASVVFIFQDKEGNCFVRDFAGSIYDIEQEGKSIERDYGLKKGGLVIGMHDVGSFGAKPVAKNGKLSSSQWDGFNNEKMTGASLLIPKQS